MAVKEGRRTSWQAHHCQNPRHHGKVHQKFDDVTEKIQKDAAAGSLLLNRVQLLPQSIGRVFSRRVSSLSFIDLALGKLTNTHRERERDAETHTQHWGNPAVRKSRKKLQV